MVWHHIFAGVTGWLHRHQGRICGRWILLVEYSLSAFANVESAFGFRKNPRGFFVRNFTHGG